MKEPKVKHIFSRCPMDFGGGHIKTSRYYRTDGSFSDVIENTCKPLCQAQDFEIRSTGACEVGFIGGKVFIQRVTHPFKGEYVSNSLCYDNKNIGNKELLSNHCIRPVQAPEPTITVPPPTQQGCWDQFMFAQTTHTFTIPRTGLYLIKISSNHADINRAMGLETGTHFVIKNFNQNERISFKLGDQSSLSYNGKRHTLKRGARANSNLSAGFSIRYIGDLANTRQPTIIPNPIFFRRLGPEWHAQQYTDGVYAKTIHAQAIVPGSNWGNFPNMTEHWYYLSLNLDKTDNYTIRVFGDDVGQLLLDGSPLIWGNPSHQSLNRTLSYHNNKRFNSIGGHAIRNLTQGRHEIIVYNKQTGGGPAGSLVSIKDSTGKEYAVLQNFKVLLTSMSCNNNYAIPKLEFDSNGMYKEGSGTHTNMITQPRGFQ